MGGTMDDDLIIPCMTHIQVQSLKKSFTVRAKDQTRLGWIRGLVAPRTTVKCAVEDLSFAIEEGELVGFIGPNGAGKTTTLKMLSGLLYPTSGTVSVLGYEPFRRDHDYLRKIALVMGQKQQLWWELPAKDSFDLNKEIYDIPDTQYQRTLGELLELFDVVDLVHMPPRTMSLGQRMKCELIAALLHRPKVLFLDEPTIGLDVLMQQHLRQFVSDYNRRYGATVILTSHYMNDVKELCKRVIIINNGRLLFDGSLAELIRDHADYKVLTVVFEGRMSAGRLAKLGKVESIDGARAHIRVDTKDVRSVASHLLSKFSIEDITIAEPEIEDVIREVFEP